MPVIRRRLLAGALALPAAMAAAPVTSRSGPKSLRIRRVRLSVVNVPETKWWWSDDVYGQPEHQRADHKIVEVETDQGLTGLAEIEYNTPLATIQSQLGQWTGRDVLQLNLADHKLPFGMALEQAVLDLRGQALGLPVWQLLGGRLRDRIPVTLCTGYKTPVHTAEQAQWGWERGFRAYKMKCITAAEDTPEKRLRYVTDRVDAIHKVLPGMVVRPDVRWRLEEGWVALELARRLQGRAMDCIESPIRREAAAGTFSEWTRLRQALTLPIADHIFGDRLVAAFRADALDYAIVGSYRSHFDTLSDSHLAHRLGMGGWSQTVAYGPGCAMGLHVAACLPNLTRPYDIVGPMAFADTLVNEPFAFEGGSFLVPDRPGLGFTLNRDAVKRFLKSERVFG